MEQSTASLTLPSLAFDMQAAICDGSRFPGTECSPVDQHRRTQPPSRVACVLADLSGLSPYHVSGTRAWNAYREVVASQKATDGCTRDGTWHGRGIQQHCDRDNADVQYQPQGSGAVWGMWRWCRAYSITMFRCDSVFPFWTGGGRYVPSVGERHAKGKCNQALLLAQCRLAP